MSVWVTSDIWWAVASHTCRQCWSPRLILSFRHPFRLRAEIVHVSSSQIGLLATGMGRGWLWWSRALGQLWTDLVYHLRTWTLTESCRRQRCCWRVSRSSRDWTRSLESLRLLLRRRTTPMCPSCSLKYCPRHHRCWLLSLPLTVFSHRAFWVISTTSPSDSTWNLTARITLRSCWLSFGCGSFWAEFWIHSSLWARRWLTI